MKKALIVLMILTLMTVFVFADRIDTKGKDFFGSGANMESYIMAARQSPDTDIKCYAIRQLGKLNHPKASEVLLECLTAGVRDVVANTSQNFEGVWMVRKEAARALGNYTIERDRIIIALRQAMMEDPSVVVQGEAALAMATIGSRAPEETKIRVVDYLKLKVTNTNKTRTQVLIPLVRAFGVNGHNSARNFLIYMRTTGYSTLVNREIAQAMRKLR